MEKPEEASSMNEIDIQTVTHRSIKGVFALVSRTFVIQIINFVSFSLIFAFLDPSKIGVFYVVSAAISFLTYFSDIGLAAALIQKKEELTQDDLKTTFTIQQGMVITIVIVALACSGLISQVFHLDSAGLFLFQAFVVAFFLSSLKTIPSILLERQIKFDKLIIPQILETCAFNITLLTLAIMGYGVLSYAWAVLARGLFGLVTLYILAPWKIQIGFSKPVAKRLLSFGIPFQSNSILALLKDDLLALYLGQVFAASQGYLGYITFAQKWAFTPLRLVMDNIIRITFPSFSRIREHEELLGKAIEKSLFAAVIIIFPALMGMAILGPYFIHFIPKYQQWEPALLSLTFFAINAALSAVSTPLTNALNAIGKVKTTLYLMVFWTIATWVLTPLCIHLFGFTGVSIASALISTSVVGVVYITKKYITFSVLKSILTPGIASVGMGVMLIILSPMVVKNIYLLLGMVGAGAVVYFAMMYVLARDFIIEDVKLIMHNLKK